MLVFLVLPGSIALLSNEAFAQELPHGVYIEKNGDLRMVILDSNSIRLQKGSQDQYQQIKCKLEQRVRQEYWCRIIRVRKINTRNAIHPKFESPGLQSDGNRGKTKQNSSPKKSLGNRAAYPEMPLPPILTSIHAGMRLVLTYSDQSVEMIVFDFSQRSILHSFQVP